MRMTKAEIVEALRERLGGLSKREATQIVDCIFEAMKQRLATGETVRISGLGSFSVREKAARMGRNPQTREKLLIEARRTLTFRPSKDLRAALNPDEDQSLEFDDEDNVAGPSGGDDEI